MVKVKTTYMCQQCAATYAKWTGRCENCGAWNSLVEQVGATSSGSNAVARASSTGKALIPTKLGDVIKGEQLTRLKTGFSELDDVLGGGFVEGGVVLIAGQPGIGKSTLLLQVSALIASHARVLYVSGEESAGQVRLRAERLGADTSDALEFAASTSANDIATTVTGGAYELVIVDSIQTLSLDEISSAPGSVSQITNASNVIIRAAKSSNTAVIMVGHVTKEGSIAGPKVLEHLVDVVLQFEGDRYGGFKIIRAIKNRYGSISEAALFDMDDAGLRPVENPSAALLAERQNADGSVVMATLEGNRPLLVEIQALVNPTSFGYPKRTSSGFDLNRLNLLVAVLERRTKLNLSDKDIYINVVGGLKLADPAADLAVAMAIASASAGRRLPEDTVVFGEVGLGGEIRSVTGVARRIAEAKKLGFKHAIAPKFTKVFTKDSSTKDSFIKSISDLRSGLNSYMEK